MSDTKVKTHVTYPKELRDAAKAQGKGLVTVAVLNPDGSKEEVQVLALAGECHFARWLARLLGDQQARPLPDLEKIYEEARLAEAS